MDVIVLFGVDDGDDIASQKPQGHESLFAVVYTIRICVKEKNSPLRDGLLDEFLQPGFTWHPLVVFRLGWTRPRGDFLVADRTRTFARPKPNGVSRTVSAPSSPLSALVSRLSSLGSPRCSPCPTSQTATLRRGL